NAKNPLKSSLWQVVADREMPPKGEPQLTAADKLIIERWIKSVDMAPQAPHASPETNPLKPGPHAQTAPGGQQPGARSGNTEATDALTAQETQLLQLVNRHRAGKGKPALLANLKLMQIARGYAALLAKKGQLDDELDDLNTPKRVLRAGYRFKIVGTDDRVTANICGNTNLSPTMACDLWLQSPPSVANFLDDYLETGVGIANDGHRMVYYYMTLATPAK